jgi:hypothetical protein
MNVEDLRNLQGEMEIEADLCVVGSAPVGPSIAREFAEPPSERHTVGKLSGRQLRR